jgi:hypothetical protein
LVSEVVGTSSTVDVVGRLVGFSGPEDAGVETGLSSSPLVVGIRVGRVESEVEGGSAVVSVVLPMGTGTVDSSGRLVGSEVAVLTTPSVFVGTSVGTLVVISVGTPVGGVRSVVVSLPGRSVGPVGPPVAVLVVSGGGNVVSVGIRGPVEVAVGFPEPVSESGGTELVVVGLGGRRVTEGSISLTVLSTVEDGLLALSL